MDPFFRRLFPALLVASAALVPGIAGEDATPYSDIAPALSPNGKFIAFQSNRDGNWEIYRVAVTGETLMRLTREPGFDGEPTWSPDGRELAFTAKRDGDDEIYVMRADGSNVRKLTDDSLPNYLPAWSPDGSVIAFVSKREGRRRIFFMKPDGSDLREIETPPPVGRIRWSADGGALTFMIESDGRHAIHRLAADGSPVATIFPEPAFSGNPQLSPDGRTFVLDAHDGGSPDSGDGMRDLWLLSSDGKRPRRLTDNLVDDGGADWSRDGRTLVFSGGGRNDNGYRIFTIHADGTGLRQVTGDD